MECQSTSEVRQLSDQQGAWHGPGCVHSLAGHKNPPILAPLMDLLKLTHQCKNVGVRGRAACLRPPGVVEDDYLTRLHLLLQMQQMEVEGGNIKGEAVK